MNIAVTGAFGFTGKYVTEELLSRNHRVLTLTNSMDRQSPFRDKIEAKPLAFKKPDKLKASLEGVEVFINTYWVRFNHKMFTHSEAVENTFALFDAIKEVGVKRIVHVSITNPSKDSPYEYFRDKALIEERLQNLGIRYSIVRPAVLFGNEDVLINNIAWALRKIPLAFGVFGNGKYRLQPIHVNDFATLLVNQAESTGNSLIIDAIGPETFTYRELVQTIARAIGVRRAIVGVPPLLGYLVGLGVNRAMNDVIITWPEIKGLMDDLLCTDSPPSGSTKLSTWVQENAQILGVRYSNELERRRNRQVSYQDLKSIG